MTIETAIANITNSPTTTPMTILVVLSLVLLAAIILSSSLISDGCIDVMVPVVTIRAFAVIKKG